MKEIEKLHEMLMFACIPHTYERLYDGHQILVLDNSIISHGFSYGGRSGLLEVMGSLNESEEDDVEGWLFASELFVRILTLIGFPKDTDCD